MDFSHAFLLIHAVVMLYNLGTIWFAQIVVYPLFHQVGVEEYVAYHREYARRIPLPVILPGFSSFLLPVVLVFFRPDPVPPWMVFANVVCAGVGFLVSVALAIPRHNRLERAGKQPQVIRELVAFNWPRTASISVSAGLSVAMLLEAFRPI